MVLSSLLFGTLNLAICKKVCSVGVVSFIHIITDKPLFHYATYVRRERDALILLQLMQPRDYTHQAAIQIPVLVQLYGHSHM